MKLRIDQIKSIKLPLNTTDKTWSCFNSCPQLVSLYDAIQSYFDTKSITLYTDSTLKGNGSLANPLGLAQQGATAGQVLTWNGASYVPATPPGGSSVTELNDLSDVNLSGLAAGDFIYYDGSQWIKARLTENTQTNNSGTVMVLPNTPLAGTTVEVYYNGIRQELNQDYTISGFTITFGFPMVLTDKLTAKYYY